MTTPRRARIRRPGGFTMLELVISMVLITIVSGIAIVGFSAVTDRSDQVKARASLDVVTAAQQRFAYAYGTYTPLPDDLTGMGARVEVVAADGSPATAAAGNRVSMAVGTDGSLALAAVSADGTCVTRLRPAYGTQGSAVDATLPDSAICTAVSVLPAGVPHEFPPVSKRW